MKISKTLINYLFNSNRLLESNILITNLNSIIYANTYNNPIKYENTQLSNDLKCLISQWEDFSNYDKFLILKDNFYELNTDNSFLYKGQMFLPIFHNKNLSGVLIFFRNNRNFIESSLKYARTIKHFVEIFTSDDYIDKNI